MAEQTGDGTLLSLWRRDADAFRRSIKKQRLYLTLLEPELAALSPEALCTLAVGNDAVRHIPYTRAQYALHEERLRQLEGRYHNLHLSFRGDVAGNTLLYVKEDTGVIMVKTDRPMSAFVFNEQSMVNAFWDHLINN